MIKEFPTYTVICDRCGADNATDGEFSGWNDKAFAVDDAMENGFIEQDGKHFCPDCVEWNEDESELVAKAIAAAPRSDEGARSTAESAVPVSGHSPSSTLVEQSEDAALPDGRWIPVSERLPEEDHHYLVTDEAMTDARCLWWTQLFGGQWVWTTRKRAGECFYQETWTHYSELPTPPTN